MPIYEYECRGCRRRFEALVRVSESAACPACQGTDLERLVSMFAVDSPGSRKIALTAGRKQHAKVQRDQAHAQHEYEQKHHH